MLSTERVVVEHERDRDGGLTILDFNSSLVVLRTSVFKSRSLAPPELNDFE